MYNDCDCIFWPEMCVCNVLICDIYVQHDIIIVRSIVYILTELQFFNRSYHTTTFPFWYC